MITHLVLTIKRIGLSSIIFIKPTCRNVCGFFATATHTLPQRVGAQTISGIRIYAGYNNNPLSVDPAKNVQHRAREKREKGDIMNEELLGKVVPVRPIKVEKVAFRENGMYIEQAGGGRGKTYSYNVLFANDMDPADGVHRFPLMPENPTFIVIDDAITLAGIELSDIPAEKQIELLPKNLKEDIYGAWINVDLSKRPVCRLYTSNVVKLVEGKPEIVHKAGDPIMQKDTNGKDTKNPAVITQLPVWGFLRKNQEGAYFWLKGYDPMTRVDREINQGRMTYIDMVIDEKGLDTGDDNTESKEDEKPKLDDAPDLATLG